MNSSGCSRCESAYPIADILLTNDSMASSWSTTCSSGFSSLVALDTAVSIGAWVKFDVEFLEISVRSTGIVSSIKSVVLVFVIFTTSVILTSAIFASVIFACVIFACVIFTSVVLVSAILTSVVFTAVIFSSAIFALVKFYETEFEMAAVLLEFEMAAMLLEFEMAAVLLEFEMTAVLLFFILQSHYSVSMINLHSHPSFRYDFFISYFIENNSYLCFKSWCETISA